MSPATQAESSFTRPVFLLGMMGSGKTSLARLLSTRTGSPYVDLDERISAHFGAPIAEVFARHGEPAFRVAEHQLLCEVVAGLPREPQLMWIATGGGIVCDSRNVELMNRVGITVWLDAPVHVLAARLASAAEREHRPLLAAQGSMEQRLTQLFYQRHRLYAQATLRLRAEQTLPELAKRLLAQLATTVKRDTCSSGVMNRF